MIDRASETKRQLVKGLFVAAGVSAVSGADFQIASADTNSVNVYKTPGTTEEAPRTKTLTTRRSLFRGPAMLLASTCASEGDGPVSAALTLTAHRLYTLFEDGKPVRDITQDLLKNPGAITYKDIDWDGNQVGTVSGVDAYFSDYGFSLLDGSQTQIFRARYQKGELVVNAYRLDRVNGSWENVGPYMTFYKDSADGMTDVRDLCDGVSKRRGIVVKKWRILAGGKTRRIKNDQIWLADDCVLHDNMQSEHYLVAPEQSATPVKEEPNPETPGRRPTPPVQVPVQLPRGGDGSTPIDSNPNIPRRPGH